MLGAKSTVFYLFERRVIRTELKVMTSLMYDVIFGTHGAVVFYNVINLLRFSCIFSFTLT